MRDILPKFRHQSGGRKPAGNIFWNAAPLGGVIIMTMGISPMVIEELVKDRAKALIIMDVVLSIGEKGNSILKDRTNAQNRRRIGHQCLVFRVSCITAMSLGHYRFSRMYRLFQSQMACRQKQWSIPGTVTKKHYRL